MLQVDAGIALTPSLDHLDILPIPESTICFEEALRWSAVIATQHNRIVQRDTCDPSYFILGVPGLRARRHLGEARRTLRMFPERVLVMGISRLDLGLRLQSARRVASAPSTGTAPP